VKKSSKNCIAEEPRILWGNYHDPIPFECHVFFEWSLQIIVAYDVMNRSIIDTACLDRYKPCMLK